ncbi:uncharacterized protein LOC126575976 [Anopheles aquasalis]|uniref:uncharacterized protein LOC126575976 n=1 Tax=Anopheles aquasalis TaxID=42839 RepID=UPI00215A1595|nr:uncharacterized protein LOC126575976 [Anopheles aquasalis]
MSPPCKRARRSLETTINSLPDEVMCMIFDRLPIRDVIRSSVTCRRWNGIIFRSNYDFRIALKVMASNWRVVTKSQRCYRHVVWKVRDQAIPSTWKTIYRKFMNNLTSLEIVFTDKVKKKSIASLVTLIAEAIPQMTKLRSLQLIDICEQDHQGITATLRSNSIRSLTFMCKFKVWVDMPQLESFEGYLYALNTPDECTHSHALDKLKELIVERDAEEPLPLSTAAIIHIIRRLKNIEKMIWYNAIEERIFIAICELCSKLKEFTFKAPMSHCNVFNMSNLKKLTHLRSLGICGLLSEQDSALDCTSLTQIEHLHLGFIIGGDVKIPKSIKKLEVNINHYTEERMIKTIISGAAHLKVLKVTFGGYRGNQVYYNEPVKLLKALSHLRQLEVFQLEGGLFNASSFLRMNVPLRRLHTLQFHRAKLVSTKSARAIRKNKAVCTECGGIGKMLPSNFNFAGLMRRFPRLNVPEFACCTMLPRHML